jgi:DNA polymerase III epsilon subunit-like protein
MIDLETMGLRPNAAIVSIGVTHFDATQIIDRFHTAVNLQSCIDAGLVTDQGTVDWWATQSQEARSSWDVPDAPPLMDALKSFGDFVRRHSSYINDVCPWGNGADFDLVLLVSAYRALDADPPWKFWNHHCFRTVKNLFPKGGTVRRGTHHNALDDAVTQTEHLQAILRDNHLTHLL